MVKVGFGRMGVFNFVKGHSNPRSKDKSWL
nr:MAG TPA: hypothetical protein [Caudoviricetes sp.]